MDKSHFGLLLQPTFRSLERGGGMIQHFLSTLKHRFGWRSEDLLNASGRPELSGDDASIIILISL
jgi:hypothetical protein